MRSSSPFLAEKLLIEGESDEPVHSVRLMRAVDRVIKVIGDRGRSPVAHQVQLARLAREWPALAAALRELLIERGAKVPEEWSWARLPRR